MAVASRSIINTANGAVLFATCTTVASARDINTPPPKDCNAIIAGGDYVWDSASVLADDGVNVIKLTAFPTGRFILQAAPTPSGVGPLNPILPPYNFVGNGTAPDTAAFQQAMDDAFTKKLSVYLPGRATAYLLADRINYQGQQLYGDGVYETILQGAPNCDIFYCPDPSVPEPKSQTSLYGSSIKNIQLVVDDSTTGTLPSAKFNRPLYPLSGNWAATTVIAQYSYYANGGNIYLAVVGGTTGNVGPTQTQYRSTDGTVQWDFIDTQQRYIGPAALAAPLNDGNGRSATIGLLNTLIENVRIVGLAQYKGSCGVYTQRGLYDSTIKQSQFRTMSYGNINTTSLLNFTNYDMDQDCVTWRQNEYLCAIPFVIYNGDHCRLDNCQFYASGAAGWKGPFIMPLNGALVKEPTQWTMENAYCEPIAGGNFMLSYIGGRNHSVITPSLNQSAGSQFVYWAANACEVLAARLIAQSGLVIAGIGNEFLRTRGSNGLSEVLDLSCGKNFVEFQNYDGVGQTNADQMRARIGVGTVGRIKYGMQNADFMSSSPLVPYTSDDDLLTDFREFRWPGALTTEFVDNTLETGGGIIPSPAAGDASSILNGSSWVVGPRLPPLKYRVVVKAKASAGCTQLLTIRNAANATLGGATLNLTTAYQLFSFDLDLTAQAIGTVLHWQPNAASGSTPVNLAWAGYTPYKSTYVTLMTFPSGATITSGTGSPNTVVTALPGSLFLNETGGAGTSLYVKESGTGNTGWVGK